MKFLRATLVALLMLAMMAFPAFAQDGKAGAGDDQQQTELPPPDGFVTKTFELTLNGDVPAGETFYVVYAETDREAAEGTFLIFCGDAELINSEPSDVDCVGEGTVYTQKIAFPAGTEIYFSFGHVSDQGEGEGFHEGTETIDEDMTNTAFFTFGKDTGAGDEQETPDNQQEGEKPDTGAGEVPDNQQDREDKDSGTGDDQEMPDNQQEGDKGTGAGDDQQDDGTGAGDEQEMPDNQQDNTEDDVQDDQQGEMPEEMPDTGAGGLAAGTTIPVGNAAAGLMVLTGAGYAMLRRR